MRIENASSVMFIGNEAQLNCAKRVVFLSVAAAAVTAIFSAQAAETPAIAATNAPSIGTNKLAEFYREFDKDGDGKISTQERADMAEVLRVRSTKFMLAREKQFDKDGDGKLNADERKSMTEYHTAQYAQLRKEAEAQFDMDCDGKLDDQERAAKHKAFMQGFTYDKNGDGKLDKTEVKTMTQDRAKKQ